MSQALRRSLIVTLAATLLLAGCPRSDQPIAPRNTGLTPDTHSRFPIASGVHKLDCNSCHGSATSFKQFECVSCHGHDQALTDRLHQSVAKYQYASAPCYSCHPTGARMAFDHAGISSGCASCHAETMPFAALPATNSNGTPFIHPPTNGADCVACHSTSGWQTGVPAGVVSDRRRDVTVNALIPSFAGTSITSPLSAQSEKLTMPMKHTTSAVAASALSTCANCHSNATAGVFYPGDFHLSLAKLTVAQPAACTDCHAGSAPTGFVGPAALSARVPASPEMRHEAVLWSGGAPTTTPAFSADCAVCHLAPAVAANTWATGKSGTGPALFHASLKAANLAQPASCLDCHANSRPDPANPLVTPTGLPGVSFDHSSAAALGDCASCHAGAATTATDWKQGKFHLANSTTPTGCLPCHAGERPSATINAISTWKSTTYSNSPFDYTTNTNGITHGDGHDCVFCHAGPGTGAWGGTQNWVGGNFFHTPNAGSLSASTCIACHVSQRPDIVFPTNAATILGFDHSMNGTGDCFGCHQATVAAGKYGTYLAAPLTAASSDWKGGATYPGPVLVSSPNNSITVTETTLIRGANNLITGTTQSSATFTNAIVHTSTAIPAEVWPGTSATGDLTRCWHCHTHSGTTVTAFSGGVFHASLTNYSSTPGGTPTGLPEPTVCFDCHAPMQPNQIVERPLIPGPGLSDLMAMDHGATFTPAFNGPKGSTNAVTGIECGKCHTHPGDLTTATQRWRDGVFHASMNTMGLTPTDCTGCHYPLMADAAKADPAGTANFAMKHGSAQMTTQSCEVCHAQALSKVIAASGAPANSTLFNPGTFHPTIVPSQPSRCHDCHAASGPAANASTQSTAVYTMPLGGTATNGAQWMNHGAADVVGKDCAVCHLADAKPSNPSWSKSSSFHGAVASPTSCQVCHGLTNGVGSTAGTNNNLPVGLTNSSTATSASNDATTGVPARTFDQIDHTEINVSSHDCSFCHSQAGVSAVPAIHGKEWAQASLHAHFVSPPLINNGTTGRCSHCHENVKPRAGFSVDHSAFTSTSPQDCGGCHVYPGVAQGSTPTPNWLGAAGAPATFTAGGFTIDPGLANATEAPITLPHPTVGSTPCTTCHTSLAGGKNAIGYDHVNAGTDCNACHEAGTNLVSPAWNGSTSQNGGMGDSRPHTITTLTSSNHGNTCQQTNTRHFYPTDCYQCHQTPAGIATGTTYPTNGTGVWTFPQHDDQNVGHMTPQTCTLCHQNPCPK